MPTLTVQMEFPDEIMVALLDPQVENTYMPPWGAKKYGKQADERKPLVRMADKHTRKLNGKC